MASTPDELVETGLDHLGRFAFFTRDNPFVSSTAALSLASNHRSMIVQLLSGQLDVDQWLATPSAKRLLSSIRVGCVPRDVQLVTRDDHQRIGVENVHAFLSAPLFWWLVSILWCLTAGRRIEPMISEHVMGYRLHPGFLKNPEDNGMMFREYRRSSRIWRRFPNSIAKQYPGQVLATNTVDLQDFYYSVRALPGAIVARFLRSQEGRAPRARHARVLTRLLNELHRRYAQRCAEVRPRPALADDSIPLPVGLPSSQILANVIVSLVVDDISDVQSVDAVAAYADDFIIMTRELPRMAEPPQDYLARLGVMRSPDPPVLASELAEPVARLIVSLAKSATSYSPTAETEDDDEGDSDDVGVALDDAELDPYIEGEPDPDWGGRLRTVLRAPHRRDRVPRELSKEVERLVDEVRIGLDADEARIRLEKIIDDIDSSLFLALRPYWTELLVSGVAARGRSFVLGLTAHFVALLEQLEPPPDSSEAMTTSLREGLRAAWIQALAQALAVAMGDDELDGLETDVPLLAETTTIGPLRTTSVVNYAKRIRARRLIPGSLVSAPLAEFTSWKGRLIGPTAYRDFTLWANGLTDDQKLAQLTRSITRSVRFVHLHEVCLALHLWVHSGVATGSWLSRAFRLLGRQPLIQRDFVAELRASAEGALNPPDRPPREALEALTRPELRFALPSLPIDDRQLDALIQHDSSALGAIASASRLRIRSVVGIAASRKADVLVLPEWSVLPQQLPYLMGRAGTCSMLTVAGQAPSIVANTYSNRIWTGIPLEDSVGHKACLIPPPREKRFLSPHERKSLTQAGVNPAVSIDDPPAYEWRGIRFASLVCFEFADIASRTALRPRADILMVSSLNKDWRYFDAIQEATTRDNYCLTVCVNTGSYPGTRIMRPTRSELSVAASVHGSDDPAVVSRAIDMYPIIAARRLQVDPETATDREPTDDAELSSYKPLPPL
jgi:hypothetical protein